MMMAVELKFDVLNIIQMCQRKGVLVLDAGRNIVRLLPPLVMAKAEASKVVDVLYQVIGENEAARVRS